MRTASHIQTAVDLERRSVDVSRMVAGEEAHDAGDLLRCTDAPERTAVLERQDPALVFLRSSPCAGRPCRRRRGW